jgi:plasmid maintenance system killer protein
MIYLSATGKAMLKTFADAETESFLQTGKSRHLPREIHKRAAMWLLPLAAAVGVDDLRQPSSNRLETLQGDRARQMEYSHQ